MRRGRCHLVGFGFVVAFLACGFVAGRADEEPAPPSEVPVVVEGDVDESEAADLGRYVLRLGFAPQEDVTRAYRIQLRLVRRGNVVLNLDHSPTISTTQWRKGKVVRYDFPFPLPLEAGLAPGDRLDLLLTFYDPDLDRTVPPRSEFPLWGHSLPLAHLVVPDLRPTDDAGLRDRILVRADELAAADRRPDAWRLLEMGIRRAEEDPSKYRFRDAVFRLGHFPPRPVSVYEEQIVAKRIADERRRHLREAAGRCYDRGKLYAALRILETVGGTLSEEAKAAVIGALAEAKRAQKDIQQIQLRLLARITDEDKAAAREAIEKLGLEKKLLEQAQAWAKEKRYGRARYVLRELSLVSDRDLAGEAHDALQAVEAAWLADTPPEEANLVESAVNHAAFGRLATVATHNFIYIGPKKLVEGIPEDSRLRYDVAFVFLTDLFGRLPNPNGDRITVFFKELWDFGGGQAGGKTIDIGRADKDRVGYRVDTGLLYHELTHCIDDTIPIYVGFREGLANMGAAYLFEAIGQKGDTLHAFQNNLEAFRRDYLGRDIAYWRIPGYGPSAGFFLHFVDTYARTPYGHSWQPYRRFFRAYREAPVRDGREPYVARALAYYLVQAFGPAAFDDLVRFRFPLVESDRGVLEKELEAFAGGEHRVPVYRDELERFPNSPLPRDLRARDMLGRGGRGSEEAVRRLSREGLGVVHDWRVIGPFRQKGADPRVMVFPPEYEIDFSKEYLSGNNMCKWRVAGEGPVVTVSPTGWVAFNFSYQDDTATYALAHVTVPEAVDGFVHVRADDDVALFVNDRLVEHYVARGQNGSSFVWWRGPASKVPDAMRFPVSLRAGRNKVLVKVKNRRGAAGFIFALSHRDGRPIDGLAADLEPPEPPPDPASAPKRDWRTVVKHVFRTKAFSGKLETAVGRFKVVNRRLVGEATDRGVAWRKYTVRPGFPKDSPSNLFWLRAKHTEALDEFRLTFDLAPNKGGIPKVVVTFQGEGGTDGLSGWNLIVHPRHKKHVQARLERYDRLVYQTVPLEPPGGEVQRLVLTYAGGRLTVTLGETLLLDRTPITPIPDRHRIGVATYGPDLGIAAFRLEK